MGIMLGSKSFEQRESIYMDDISGQDDSYVTEEWRSRYTINWQTPKLNYSSYIEAH